MAYTGRKIVTKTKRVRNDITDPFDPNYRAPVDANSVPLTTPGAGPQQKKSNLPGDPDYIAPYDSVDCDL